MLVKNIDSGEFSRLLPAHVPLEDLMAGQVEWFGNKARSLIGTIAAGKGKAAWNYAVLRRDRTGDFRVCDVRANFLSRKAARADFLLATMGTGPSKLEQDVSRMDGR